MKQLQHQQGVRAPRESERQQGIGEHLGTFGGHLRDKWSHHLAAV